MARMTPSATKSRCKSRCKSGSANPTATLSVMEKKILLLGLKSQPSTSNSPNLIKSEKNRKLFSVLIKPENLR